MNLHNFFFFPFLFPNLVQGMCNFTIKKKREHQTGLYWPLNSFQEEKKAKTTVFSPPILKALAWREFKRNK